MKVLGTFVLHLLIVAFAVFSCYPRWGGAEQLSGDLRCGMTFQELSALAQKHQPDEFSATTPSIAYGSAQFQKDNTLLWFYFTGSRLSAVREGRYTGPTQITTYSKMDLCTGRRTIIALVEVADERYSGGRVVVDGVYVGQLSSNTQTADVELSPSMKHEIRIEKDGVPPLVKQVVLDGDTQGTPRLRLDASS